MENSSFLLQERQLALFAHPGCHRTGHDTWCEVITCVLWSYVNMEKLTGEVNNETNDYSQTLAEQSFSLNANANMLVTDLRSSSVSVSVVLDS